jgi:lysophospholipase L1-like esterase
MEQDHTLIATDGLHPSAKGYALWAKEIEPIVERLLK